MGDVDLLDLVGRLDGPLRQRVMDGRDRDTRLLRLAQLRRCILHRLAHASSLARTAAYYQHDFRHVELRGVGVQEGR